MNERLIQIYEAGCRLFINRGYSKTQIKDIAWEAGISVGTMYHYFVSKADILSFILKVTIQPSFINSNFDLPISSKLFLSLEEDIKETFEKRSEAFASPFNMNDREYNFEKMLNDAFDTISLYGKGFLLIENNPCDMGSITKLYRNYRSEFFNQMVSYMENYQENGSLRVLEHTKYSTMLIIETIAWWGMHVMNDAFMPHKDISSETARQVCMDALLNAYLVK